MAVFAVHTWRPVSGRAADLVASMTRAGAILEANGAVTSIWQPIAGGDAGTLAFVDAYDDQVAYGRTMDAIRTSADFQAFWAEALADPSGTNIENYVMSDFDATEGLPTEISRVLVTVVFRTTPGRLADHLAAQGTARSHLERLGARVRTVQAIGRADGTIGTLLGFEDFTHYGEFGAKLAVDEQWMTFWGGLAADPPAVQVESGIASLLELPAS